MFTLRMNLTLTNNVDEYVESCVSMDHSQGVIAQKKKKKKGRQTRRIAAHPDQVLEIRPFIYLGTFKKKHILYQIILEVLKMRLN